MQHHKYIKVKNRQSVPLGDIPVLDYENEFVPQTNHLLSDRDKYVFCYYGRKTTRGINTFMLIADDAHGDILLYSSLMHPGTPYTSVSKETFCAEKFERELYENFGIQYEDHPWLKPVRYAFNRADRNLLQAEYPFYKIESEHLHEVGVGPIHAGVIEPGHFRFICSGEEILHLEIQLGYQHRGIEHLMLENKKPSYRLCLTEAIAGDTAIGHSYTYCALMESLSDAVIPENAKLLRMILLELERIANHTFDLGNLCVGLAYQPVSSILGKLRGVPLNMMMNISGDRFGKGCLKPGGLRKGIDKAKIEKLLGMLAGYEKEFIPTAQLFLDSSYAMNRVETCGIVDASQIKDCGFVGIAAKMSNVKRDVRNTHPYDFYETKKLPVQTENSGDVKARIELRIKEVIHSIDLVRTGLENLDIREDKKMWSTELIHPLQGEHLCVSLTEGFRGVICHVATTNNKGEIDSYKFVDPSFHNWLALALACRGVGISDFPINNKSFNQSYCGHDL